MYSLIDNFIEKVSGERPKPESEPIWSFMIDEILELSILEERQNGIVVLIANLGKLPEENTSEFALKLLQGNWHWKYTGGATLGIDPDSHKVELFIKDSVHNFNTTSFEEWVEIFTKVAFYWKQLLESSPTDTLPEAGAIEQDFIKV